MTEPTVTGPAPDSFETADVGLSQTPTDGADHHHRHHEGKMSSIIDKVRDAISPNRGGRNSRDSSRDAGADGERGRSILHHHGHGHNEQEGHVVSTGRGGAGNIHRSRSPPGAKNVLNDADTPHLHLGDDGSERGREGREAIVHTGRGGAGNVRSPSRNPEERARVKELEAKDREVEEHRRKEEAAHPHLHSSGRGGLGNIH